MIQEDKNRLRQVMRTKSRLLSPAYCRTADEDIRNYVLSLPEYKRARTVFSYVSMDHEIDTKNLIAVMLAEGKRVAVPLCVGKGTMEARQIQSLGELWPRTWGILEPPDSAPVVAPCHIDVALIPCVCGNEKGQRLGYGGGFYDAYLQSCACTKILLCRRALMAEIIPVEEHDVVMDIVVSEGGAVHVPLSGKRE